MPNLVCPTFKPAILTQIYRQHQDAEDDPGYCCPLTVSLLQSLAICSRCEYCGVSGQRSTGRPRKRAEDFQISSHVSPARITVRLTLDESQSKEGVIAPSLPQYSRRQHRPSPSPAGHAVRYVRVTPRGRWICQDDPRPRSPCTISRPTCHPTEAQEPTFSK